MPKKELSWEAIGLMAIAGKFKGMNLEQIMTHCGYVAANVEKRQLEDKDGEPQLTETEQQKQKTRFNNQYKRARQFVASLVQGTETGTVTLHSSPTMKAFARAVGYKTPKTTDEKGMITLPLAENEKAEIVVENWIDSVTSYYNDHIKDIEATDTVNKLCPKPAWRDRDWETEG